MRGDLPTGWDWCPLGDLATVQKGRLVAMSANITDTARPYLGASAFEGHPLAFTDAQDGVDCQLTDILMLWDGERSGLSATGLTGVLSSTAARLRPNGLVSPKYLFYQLVAAFEFIQARRTGTGVPHVPKDLATLLWVPVPRNKVEQQRIADILDTADVAIQQTEALIAKLKRMRTGLLHDLLTCGLDERGQLRDPVAHPEQFKESELGLIPVAWRVRRLRDIALHQNGKAFPSSDYGDNGIPLLRPGNLPDNDFVRWDSDHTTYLPLKWQDEAREYVVRGNEVVMNLTAQSLDDQFLGRVCMTLPETRCLLNQRIARFVSMDCHLPYLFWSLKGPHFRAQIDRLPQGTKVQHIYERDLDAVNLAVPSSSGEQVSIAEILFTQSALIHKEEVYRDKLKLVTEGLMEDLLTGRVRVPVEEGVTA
jgi:type I restriction enzyme, S subunit